MLTNQNLHTPPKTDALINVTGAGKGGQRKSSTPGFYAEVSQRVVRAVALASHSTSIENTEGSPRRRLTFPVLTSSSKISTCQEDGMFRLKFFRRGLHPDRGEVPVPPNMAAGARPPCNICRGKTLSSIHLFILCPVMSAQTARPFPRQGGRRKMTFRSCADVGAPSEKL